MLDDGLEEVLKIECRILLQKREIQILTEVITSKRLSKAQEVVDEGLLLNDDLVAVKTDDGKVSIKNATTGKITIKDIKLDWTQRSRNDSLAWMRRTSLKWASSAKYFVMV